MLEFFDYFLIGYVVAFIAGPWKLTFGESAVILLSSGFGAMFGAVFYGWLADKIGRRKVFLMTVINFSIATGILTFTPDNAWIFLSVFRFLIGFGVGGLYCVDLPLVQEFVPASKARPGGRPGYRGRPHWRARWARRWAPTPRLTWAGGAYSRSAWFLGF